MTVVGGLVGGSWSVASALFPPRTPTSLAHRANIPLCFTASIHTSHSSLRLSSRPLAIKEALKSCPSPRCSRSAIVSFPRWPCPSVISVPPHPTTYIRNRTVRLPMTHPRMMVSLLLRDWIRPNSVFIPGSVSAKHTTCDVSRQLDAVGETREIRDRVKAGLTECGSHPRVDVLKRRPLGRKVGPGRVRLPARSSPRARVSRLLGNVGRMPEENGLTRGPRRSCDGTSRSCSVRSGAHPPLTTESP